MLQAVDATLPAAALQQRVRFPITMRQMSYLPVEVGARQWRGARSREQRARQLEVHLRQQAPSGRVRGGLQPHDRAHPHRAAAGAPRQKRVPSLDALRGARR